MQAFLAGLREFFSACAVSVRRTFSAHLPLYLCAVVFVSISAAVGFAYHAPISFTASIYFLTKIPEFLIVYLFIGAVVQFVRLVRKGSESPIRDFGRALREALLANDRPGNVVHSLLTVTPLMVSFSALKEALPLIHPFTWDPTFERWDRVLGFGRAPWEVLQPLLGHPPITWAINGFYTLWFVVIFGTLIWQCFFARAGYLRSQYLLAFSCSWFLAGNLLAVIFSSAGPCYYGFLYLPDPYAAQLEYLERVAESWPMWSVKIQDTLWQSYAATKGINTGIAAMPSMHVLVSVLTAMVGRKTNKWLGRALTFYASVIFIGSFHLAWHYAIDAIAGVALAFAFWAFAGKVVHRHGQ